MSSRVGGGLVGRAISIVPLRRCGVALGIMLVASASAQNLTTTRPLSFSH